MTRNITVEFDDGSSHRYENAPDDVTPEQITERAQKDFAGRTVTHLDGGKATTKPEKPAKSPDKKDEYSSEEYEAYKKQAVPDANIRQNLTPEAEQLLKSTYKAKKEGLGGLI